MGLHHPMDKGMIVRIAAARAAVARAGLEMEGVTSMRRFLVWVALVSCLGTVNVAARCR